MTTFFRGEDAYGLPDVLVFGSGTVGRPVLRHLEALGVRAHHSVAVPWDDSDARRATLDQLRHQLLSLARGPLRVVWAAGATGFSATREDTKEELAAFTDVVHLAEQLLDDRRHDRSALHVVSSAGGLFEGRTVRSADEEPSPRRPYGELKLLQERTAMRLGRERVIVHRPSSIFSSSLRGNRPGLIGVMVENSAARRPTTIYGSPTTLRDYVHAESVGRHIAAAALTQTPQPSPQFLISGRPTAIHEVVAIVEKTMRRPVYLRFVDPWNTSDIVFVRSARAPGFSPESLEVGVRRLHAEWVSHPRQVS